MSFRWDDKKEEYLRKRFQDDPQTPISHFEEYFGISYNAVRFKLKRMGIQISSIRKGEVVIKPEVEDEETPAEEVWDAYEKKNEQKIARHKSSGRYIAEFLTK